MTALHGFLGLPSDWNEIPCAKNAHKPDWMPALASITVGHVLFALADHLNSSPDDEGTLMGYSMGGRIALHMLIEDAEKKWKRAIIVSASPGLEEGEDRAARMSSDVRWAERFHREPWEETVKAWNSQGVFSNDPGEPMIRLEREFERYHLAKALVLGSVAVQSDLRKPLSKLEIPLLWIAGDRDLKYAALATECASLNPRFQTRIIPGAGHRVPWTHPVEFCHAVCDFLNER